ncbi:Glucose-6-phosphate 1-dehydrogenase [Liberibacter crescens BT-1]|uniref:Glucose-6-phosphate 1-dehydrogenase n=1 Tax=Liberibacter crescens (strain BT-1) TaxID=1215343 RepID=L0EU55_LIBCB|nr:glucose-6-phosphate dehydrogenase [Liberibacter crescens]AGA64385.1 Glucose-6-phosphate 1-dehydrogenase [Liberibacter crescens BT-1]AMC12570.1 glucose-6-phosphate dehydrogenase [Liberibacter crescens]
MKSQIIPVEPFDYVVFGGTGDLATRKLLPALYNRQAEGQITSPSRIISVSRTPMSTDEYRQFAHDTLQEYLKENEYNTEHIKQFLHILQYVVLDVQSHQNWNVLKNILEEGKDWVRAFYLAVSPELFGTICEKIHEYDLITHKTRLVIEKPIGHDLSSAKILNKTIGKVFNEEQIFRIDHYLGKETVQNLMALRFANALYEPLWNYHHINHIQITAAEEIGTEKRVSYYNKAGALRDMVQNHMLQLLCLVAMETPVSINAESVRNEKLKVLSALKPITPEKVECVTIRGQYQDGIVGGQHVKSYLEELGTETSDTETFVAIKAEIKNWRWAGVPFYIRTGKRLTKRVSEIIISFKAIPHSIFDATSGHIIDNKLIIRLQPNDAVKQLLMIKDPGPGGMRLKQTSLDMYFAQAFKVRNPDAYERLLMDVIRANQTLFMRCDEVEAAWSWVDSILQSWGETKQPVKGYASGSWGPEEAMHMIEKDGYKWHEKD